MEYKTRLSLFQKNQSLYEVMLARLIDDVPSGGTFVDCGAHLGMHTKNMLARHDVNNVLAIEAIPELAKNMRDNLGHDSRLSVFQCAVGNRIGTAEFKIASNLHGYSGLKQRNIGAVNSWESISVDLTTLDKIVSSMKLVDPIKLIKMDLEGGEFDALTGARHVLEAHQPIVIFENGLQKSAEIYGYSKGEFFNFLSECRYEVYDFFGNAVNDSYWDSQLFTYMFTCVPRGSELMSWYLDNHLRISTSVTSKATD